jgi:integrase
LPVAESKKKRKERRIVLRGEALELVKVLAEEYPTGPLFRRTSGNPWTASGLAHAVRKVAELAGVDCSAYAFRHSVATDATRAGENPIILATALGTSVQMLENVYAHVNDTDVQGLNERLGY